MGNGVLGYLRIGVLCCLVVVGMVKRRLIMRSVTAFTPYRDLHIKNAVNLTAKNTRRERSGVEAGEGDSRFQILCILSFLFLGISKGNQR